MMYCQVQEHSGTDTECCTDSLWPIEPDMFALPSYKPCFQLLFFLSGNTTTGISYHLNSLGCQQLPGPALNSIAGEVDQAFAAG